MMCPFSPPSPRPSVLRARRIVVVLAVLWLATSLGRVVRAEQPAMPAPQEESTPGVHVVRAGETLSEIAQAYGVSLDDLMRLNGIRNVHTIYAGQSLRLPSQVGAPVAETAPRAVVEAASLPAAAIASLNRTYTVRSGDTVGRLALRFGVDQTALRALNGLPLRGDAPVRVGQRLVLPATPDELQVTAPTRRYTVRAGDTLSLIAQRFGLSLEALLAANRIGDADSIYVGQELTIPGQVLRGERVQVGPAQSGFLYHRVRPGETMSELSQKFNTTPQAIVRYNDLPDASTLFAGLEIRIPYGPPQMTRRLPPAPRSGTEFIVSLSRQRCWVMRNARVVYEWKCSTGYGQWSTRTGTFPIKTRMEMAQSSAYRLDMPYWLGLYDVGEFENGIHGLPVDWGTGRKLWDSLVGQPATFGCAMLLDEDAAVLYDLSYIGMLVHIVD